MEPSKIRKKIGERLARGLAIAALLLSAAGASADDVRVNVGVDRNTISEDETVSLKFDVKSDGNSQASSITFDAPDFEVVNEFNSTYIESYYENGRFGMRNNQQVTKVLRPRRRGTFKITNIRVTVDGKNYGGREVAVTVGAGGAGTPPPRNYGGAGQGLRGAGKRTSNIPVFVRAEIDKDHAFKGEQVIVSYYLYRRVRVFNIQVDKYPVLSGFLREDLEMPILGQRLESERVVLDGVPFERSLLARYAAYPLQQGKLRIDTMALKYQYYLQGDQDEDPFASFFRQMAPHPGESRSEQLTVEVLPVPEDGKPATFSGGVGDFTLTTAVDKYEVRANEAVTLTVKIEGRGNLSSIQEPKTRWPDSVELYDAKGRTKTGAGGVGERIFEFLLIPRSPGKLILPKLEFSFFDPIKKAYYTRTTEEVPITVAEAAPGSAPAAPNRVSGRPTTGDSMGATGAPKSDRLSPLMPAEDAPTRSIPVWRWLYWVSLAGLCVFVLAVGWDLIRRRRASSRLAQDAGKGDGSKRFARLRAAATAVVAGAPWAEVTRAYEDVCGALFDAIDRQYAIGARSLPRSELRRELVEERQMPEPLWERIAKILEYAETVRFAASAGALSENAVRQQLAHSVAEVESISRVLEKKGK